MAASGIAINLLLVLPLLIKRELDRRPLEERQFTLKQIYAGMGLAHLAIILAGIYRLLTVRDCLLYTSISFV